MFGISHQLCHKKVKAYTCIHLRSQLYKIKSRSKNKLKFRFSKIIWVTDNVSHHLSYNMWYYAYFKLELPDLNFDKNNKWTRIYILQKTTLGEGWWIWARKSFIFHYIVWSKLKHQRIEMSITHKSYLYKYQKISRVVAWTPRR